MTFVQKLSTYLPLGNSDAIFPNCTHWKPNFPQNQVEICTKLTNIHIIFIEWLHLGTIFQENQMFCNKIDFCTYPSCHYFFPQIKCGFWSPTYLPLVTMSPFLLFFFFEGFPNKTLSFLSSTNVSTICQLMFANIF